MTIAGGARNTSNKFAIRDGALATLPVSDSTTLKISTAAANARIARITTGLAPAARNASTSVTASSTVITISSQRPGLAIPWNRNDSRIAPSNSP